jgi:hypothetical protein
MKLSWIEKGIAIMATWLIAYMTYLLVVTPSRADEISVNGTIEHAICERLDTEFQEIRCVTPFRTCTYFMATGQMECTE